MKLNGRLKGPRGKIYPEAPRMSQTIDLKGSYSSTHYLPENFLKKVWTFLSKKRP
jgi:hypothetical protein